VSHGRNRNHSYFPSRFFSIFPISSFGMQVSLRANSLTRCSPELPMKPKSVSIDFLDPQHRTRDRPVVGSRLDDLARRDFKRDRRDLDRVVGGRGRSILSPGWGRRPQREQRGGAERRAPEQLPPAQKDSSPQTPSIVAPRDQQPLQMVFSRWFSKRSKSCTLGSNALASKPLAPRPLRPSGIGRPWTSCMVEAELL
jgi:hypothetical protein